VLVISWPSELNDFSSEPNPKIDQHNMIPMTLPDVHADDIYNQADDVRRLSEWVFSSTFHHVPSPTQETVTFARSPIFLSAPKSPSSPRESHRPAPLDLNGDDNFVPPQAIHSILRAPRTGDRPLTPDLPVDNVFCLSGPAQSGKTQLAARMCEWLLQLKCLGGYFTFDGGFDRPTLDALPITLIHQIATTERDSIGSFRKALSVRDGVQNHPLVERFETLFVEPLRDFVAGRANGRWTPLDPLVFIIDGLGGRGGEGSSEDEDAAARMMVELICSSGFGKLPGFVKFLVLMRSETEVERLLKEKGVAVYEMGSGAVEVSSGVAGMNGSRWPLGSNAVKSSNRTPLANQL
jgi:hypothetical protein